LPDFCPNCKSLLRLRERGSRIEKYCPRCSRGAPSYREAEVPEPMPEPEPPKAASYPTRGHPSMPMFPYPEVRKGQDGFIRDVAVSIKERKHLLAYAPTGIGKTVAALAPAVDAAMATGKLVCFLTSKQSQHHIAIETLRMMASASGKEIRVVDLISKQAMCPDSIAEEYPAAFRNLCWMGMKTKSCRYFANDDDSMARFLGERILHVEEAKSLAARRGVCPHKAAMEAAKRAHVVVCDYNHIFDPGVRPQAEEAFGRPSGDLIVIVDEAHNLPDRIRGYYTNALTTGMIDGAVSEVREKYQAQLLKGLRSDLQALMMEAEEGKEKLTTPQALLESFDRRMSHGVIESVTLESFIEELRDIGQKRLLDGRESRAMDVAEFLEYYRREMRGLVRMISRKEGQMLMYRLLDPSTVAEPIFASFHSSVLMSGTLHPPGVYADILGIPGDARILGSYKSPFPEENRPIFVAEDVTTLYEQRNEAMYRRIAGRIDEVCSSAPGNVACFFQSYGMMSSVLAHVRSGKVVIPESKELTKAEKRQVIEDLVRLKSGKGGLMMAVMGGSMSEGIDYRDNLLDSVIVVGVPFAPPSLEQDLLIEYFDGKFGRGRGRDYGYNCPAMSKVLQAVGRCIRSETDRATVVLLDKRFAYPSYRKYFPADVRLRPGNDLKRQLAGFYRP
jgi:DNA excision repair protein ERCC-2